MRQFLSVIVAALGVLAALVFLLAALQIPILDSLALLWQGAAGDRFGLARSAAIAGPIVLTGLGVTVAWRAGLYNIGGEGQMVMGGLAAALAYIPLQNAPAWIAQILIPIAAMLGGGAYGLLASWLWSVRGVPLVISTILLNFVAIQILGWAVTGPLQEPKHQLPQTMTLPGEAMFFRPDRQTDLHAGLLLALLAGVAVWIGLYRTTFGFRVRVMGANPGVAYASGWNLAKHQHVAMLVSGSLCGLAASMSYQGVSGTLDASFSQGWGYMGIPVALLGGLHPLGTLGSGALLGGLFAGSDQLARFTPSGSAIVVMLQGVAVLGFVLVQSRKRAQSELMVGE